MLTKVDNHTIAVRVADLTFIPLPARPAGNLAGLVTLTLPQGVRVGQTFKMNVQQYSGVSSARRAHKMLGAFQFSIPVQKDADILPRATRNLSILRYVQQTIPTGAGGRPSSSAGWMASRRKLQGLVAIPQKSCHRPLAVTPRRNILATPSRARCVRAISGA